MPIAHVDVNRGNDTTGNGSINNPYRNPQRVANWTAGAGGGILFANDSFFDFTQTLAASNALSLSGGFNGVLGDRAFIDGYDPPGVGALTTKPTFRARMLPTPADWSWDSTIQFGEPKGWYLQFARNATHWDARVKVGGEYAVTMNQDTTSNNGGGYINGGQNGNHPGAFVNGMSMNSLRFNLDFAGASVNGSTQTRLYLSGFGLRTPGAGNDPSSIYGPGQIEVSFGTCISMYDAGNHTTVANLRVVKGAGLLTYQGTADTVRQGFEVRDIELEDVCSPLRINQGTGSAASTRWQMDIHHITANKIMGPVLYAYGGGITGTFRDSEMRDGNLCSSMGGATYMQIDPTTQGGSRDPFVNTRLKVWRWANGTGNNEFDGGAYYCDVNDNGTIHVGCWAFDCFVAMQCGSGKKAEWYSMLAINCEVFAMFNNPNNSNRRASNYRLANSLFIAAPRGTFRHGDVSTVHLYHAPIYHVGPTAELVALEFDNNIMVNAPGATSEIPLLLGNNQNWTDGKARARNNLFVGYGARLVDSFERNNKTAEAIGTLSPSTVLGWANEAANDYRLGRGSGLIGAGYEFARPKEMADAAGLRFQSPPSVGPHERLHTPDWFWRAT